MVSGVPSQTKEQKIAGVCNLVYDSACLWLHACACQGVYMTRLCLCVSE